MEDRGFCPMPCHVRATLADGSTVDELIPVDHWLAGHREATLSFPSDVRELRIDPERNTLDIELVNNVWKRD